MHVLLLELCGCGLGDFLHSLVKDLEVSSECQLCIERIGVVFMF